MKNIILALLVTGSVVLAAPLPKFSVQCPKPGCPLGKQELEAKKIAVTGSTTATNGVISERVITFKCTNPKCGTFTARNRVFVPAVEEAVEIKR